MTTTTPKRHELELAGGVVTVERPSALKATRAFALMRELSRAMPDLQTHLATFRREYERENVVELDRVQAKLQYPPRPLFEEAVGDDGQPVNRPVLGADGQPLMRPSPVDRLTEDDWKAAGGVYRIAASPSGPEIAVALFDGALEAAERHVYRLLALFTIGNAELKRARQAGTLDAVIGDRVDELLDDAYADELLELAVVVGEAIDHHMIRKSRELGDRLGNVLRLAGIDLRKQTSPPPSTPTPPASKPSSSTDTQPTTQDGAPTPSSTPPMTSSSSSPSSSPETTESESSPSSSSEPLSSATAA